jgi:sugar lactone lactonase YvrE
VVAADGAVFVVDRGNHCVRRIAPTGEVTTVAGDGVSGYVDGPAAQARFNAPEGLALTASGTLLVADTGNHRIRVVSAAGVVSTLAGSGSKAFGNGEGLAASFNTPVGLALDALGTLYVADSGNHRIRAVSPAGAVSTWAGTGVAGTTDGAAGSARFNSPRDLAFEADGSLLVLDHNSQRLRRVSTAGVVTTVAGGAPGFADGPAGTFHRPRGLATGVDGTIYVCDYSGLRAVVAQRVVTLVPNGVGSRDGARAVARFNHPYGLALAPNGDLYVSEEINHRIRAISPTGEVRTVAGSTAGFQDGSGGSASFNAPAGLAFGPDGSLVVADRVNNRIRMVSPTGGVSTLAGAAAGYADGTGAAAQFNRPIGVAVDASGRVYVADAGNHRIRVITAAGVVTTLAGSGAAGTADGPPASAAFNSPQALLLLPDGGLIVAEGGSHRIRRVTPEGAVSTLAGSTQGAADGLGPEAAFANPSGLALEPSGSIIVSDGWGQRLRRVTPEGRVTTLAGSVAGHMDGAGATALFDHPRGLAIAPDGSLFVAERNGHVIRVVR